MPRKWTRERVIAELISLYRQGENLSSRSIARHHKNLHYAIYRGSQNGRRFFNSMKDAREAVARVLELTGDKEGAAYFTGLNMVRVSRESCLEELYHYVKEGHVLHRERINRENPQLTHRISRFFDSFYQALGQVYQRLREEGWEKANYANPEYWKNFPKLRLKRRAESRRRRALAQVRSFNFGEQYEQRLEGLSPGKYSGEEIWRTLKESGVWLTPSELALQLDTSPININKVVLLNFPERVLRFVSKSGKRTWNLIHKSVADDYQRQKKGYSKRIDSTDSVSRQLGQKRSKIRAIVQQLNLGTRDQNGKIHLSDEDIEKIKEALNYEKEQKRKIIAQIDPNKNYSFGELDRMGINATKLRDSPYVFFGPRNTRKGPFLIKKIPGKVVLEYIDPNWQNPIHPLRRITHFHPQIYTSRDLMDYFQVCRSTIIYRLKKLLKEQPQACFRIRKSPTKSLIFTTKNVIPILENWHDRGVIELGNVLGLFSGTPLKREVRRAIKDIEELVKEGPISRQDQQEALERFQLLHRFWNQAIEVGDIKVGHGDLAVLYNYMRIRQYPYLDLGELVSIEQLEQEIDDTCLLEKVLETKGTLAFAIAQGNQGLIHSYIRKRFPGIEKSSFLYERLVDAGTDGVIRAVEGFDPTAGFEFSSYAWQAIRTHINRELRKDKKKPTSLQIPYGEDRELQDIIPVDEETNQGRDIEIRERNKIIQKILSQLTPRERTVIIRRFGLDKRNRKTKTLQKIGDELGISRERVRQLEEIALEKISKNPEIAKLRVYLI